MNITSEIISRDYCKLKYEVKRCIDKGKWESACSFIKSATLLMYNSNIIYSDIDLEENLKIISEAIHPIPLFEPLESNEKRRIVFYDFFVWDNRGLTEQYLDALFASDYEMLFIGCSNGEKSREILQKLKLHKVKSVFVNGDEEISRSKCIYDAILNFKPAIIFAHTSPEDIAGLMAISRFENCCTRYMTNITDHAFWLGTKVFDYFFEFRDYGYNISKRYRHIEEEKLLKLPYYPIINKDISFQGFDFNTQNKKIVFSGGSIYKTQGSPVFWDIVKYILSKYEDTIFLFLGDGDSFCVHKFIEDNDFQHRFYYRNVRKDIWEVFKHCDMYLNTYPLIGGLMTQYACMAGLVPLTLNDNNDACNNIYELLLNRFDLDFQFDSVEKCKAKIDYYLQHPDSLQSDGVKLSKAVISPEKFSEMFLKFLEKPKNIMDVKQYDVDVEKFSKQYLKRFNEHNGMSYYRFFVRRDIKYLFHFPMYYVKYIFCRLKLFFTVR